MCCCCSSLSLIIYFVLLLPTTSIKYDEERKKGVPYKKAAMKSLLIPFVFMIIYLAILFALYVFSFLGASSDPELYDGSTLLTMLFSGIIDMICATVPFFVIVIYAFVTAKKDQKRQTELDAMPGRIQRFIDLHGYASTQDFISYCMNSPDFESSRGIDYINPEYERQQKIKEQTQSNEPINVPHYIGLSEYIPIPYKEFVETRTKEKLIELIPGFYIFDVNDLYEKAAVFHSYYKFENTFPSLVHDLAYAEFRDKYVILKKDDGTNYYISKLSPEEFELASGCESNMVEGETLEISLDD